MLITALNEIKKGDAINQKWVHIGIPNEQRT